jgi:hypothetical protein
MNIDNNDIKKRNRNLSILMQAMQKKIDNSKKKYFNDLIKGFKIKANEIEFGKLKFNKSINKQVKTKKYFFLIFKFYFIKKI